MSFYRSYEQARENYKPMRRTALRSRTSLKSNKPMKRSTKRLGPGKKTKAWDSARATIKRRFEKAGITTCEFTFPHECWQDEGLSFAHSCKRNDPLFEMDEVALACPQAHEILDERMSHAEMRQTVKEAIARRPVVV